MSWLTTFSFVMKSNITALRDRIADPERMIHQLLIDMDEELTGVRASVAKAIADEILLEKKVKAAQVDADRWRERAEVGVKRGGDASARLALQEQESARSRYESWDNELQEQRTQTESLRRSVRDLEDKIRQARQKQTLLLARMSRAKSSQKINQAMERAGANSAFSEFKRLEAQVDQADAMSQAYDRLDGQSREATDLEEQFESMEREDRIDQQLAALKQRLSDD